MFSRIMNLWRLGKYQPKENTEGISLTSDPKIEGKPKGQATIVEMQEPIDQFPNESEI